MKTRETPGRRTRGIQTSQATNLNGGSSIALTADIRSLTQRRDYYVRVYSQRRDGVVSVQVFADLRSAERKVDRVRAHGLAARMELIRVLAVMPLDDRAVV